MSSNFLVFERDYDDLILHGIFSTEKKADAYNERVGGNRFEVQEFVVDEHENFVPYMVATGTANRSEDGRWSDPIGVGCSQYADPNYVIEPGAVLTITGNQLNLTGVGATRAEAIESLNAMLLTQQPG